MLISACDEEINYGISCIYSEAKNVCNAFEWGDNNGLRTELVTGALVPYSELGRWLDFY